MKEMGVCKSFRAVITLSALHWGEELEMQHSAQESYLTAVPLACRDRQTQVWGGGNTTADERGAKQKMKED